MSLSKRAPRSRRMWVVLIVLAVLAAMPTSTVQAKPGIPLSHQGRWITDDFGRVVILHGLNMIYKRPPYAPDAIGFGRDDADFLRAHGFNTVRLGLIYAGAEPQPGAYDAAYIKRVARTETLLASRGIFSQIDFHQDLYNERFQGEGWPDWAVLDDGLPAQPQVGFPGNYLVQPGLNRAFDNFWGNAPGPGGVGLQDRYAAAWRRVAQVFRSHPHTLGFDLLNEPWPGSVYSTCANPAGCPAFDINELTSFHKKVFAAIRQVERQKLIWFEPALTYDFGAQSYHGNVNDAAAGWSFHIYCLPGALGLPTGSNCEALENLVFDNADARSAQTGDALLLSEFGATDDLETIGRMVNLADDHMVSWQEWHYCNCEEPTSQASGDVQALVLDPRKPPTGANVKKAKLDLLERPYPQVVAGTPTSYGFDEDKSRFELRWSTALVSGKGAFHAVRVKGGPRRNRKLLSQRSPQSEIFIPRNDYPKGYEAKIEGGGIASPPGARILRVAACPGVEKVSVLVTKPSGDPVADGPDCAVAHSGQRLRLKLRPGRTAAHTVTTLRARVRSPDGRAVAGALVRIGSFRARTNDAGKASFCALLPEGVNRARAVKRGFISDRAKVRGVPIGQAPGKPCA